jgi:6-phosphofructokinase 1
VVVAEGDEPGGAYAVAERIWEGLDTDCQVATLGPAQRGGSPTMRDRVLGAILGDEAVAALRGGADRMMVGLNVGTVVHTPLERAWSTASHPPEDLHALMHRLAG